MSVTLNNLFNFSRPLPAPFDTLPGKKIPVSSRYGDSTEATLCATVIKAVNAICACMQGSDGAVGVIDHRTVAEYKSAAGPETYHLVVYDSGSGGIMASVYNKDTEVFENYVLNNSNRDGAAVVMAMFPVLMKDSEFQNAFETYYGQYTGSFPDMIQRAILDIYSHHAPEEKVCCCAPTGRAARRMEDSTGFPASTIHRALNLMPGEEGGQNNPEPIDAKLVLVDEMSMLDIYLANKLLDAVMLGSKLVLIGDADQLPSVGPGAVLSEMIASGCVPIVRLDKVFRQEAGSRIAANAKLIRDGYKTLEWGEDFTFVESPSIEESAEKIVRLYLHEVDKYGLDNVALLTPYRKKTETGVDALNARLRDLVNPPSPRKPEAHHGRKSFRVGDKVMQIKNAREVNNGDVGYIFNISYGEDVMVQVDFSGRTVDYSTDELALLDWAYASTVHKAQGSEYESVIVNLQKAHYIMLNRPLVYTAITRGKSKVTLVGEQPALTTAIGRIETEKRGTCLAQRIREGR